jgi:hypothetical protein
MHALRAHVTRAGLSVALVGLAAATLGTGRSSGVTAPMADHAAMAIAMEKAAVTAHLGGAAFTRPAAPTDVPASGPLVMTFTTKGTKGVPALVAPGYHAITVIQGGKKPRGLILLSFKNTTYTPAQLATDGKKANGDGPAAEKAFLRIVKNMTLLGGVGTSPSKLVPTTRAKTPRTTYTPYLPPGRYVAVNTSDDGSDPREYHTPFTVTAGAPVGTKPTAAATVSPFEYGFSLSKAIKPGKHMYAFRNKGQQAHITVLASVPPGTTNDKLIEVLSSDGPPPAGYAFDVDASGVISKKQVVYRNLTFTKGTYALICFMPEQVRKNAPPHFLEGMIKIFTVA